MADSNLNTLLSTGGGNIHYLYHVSGYPWAVTTSQSLIDLLDSTTYILERRDIFGYAVHGGSHYFADEQHGLTKMFPTLLMPKRQSISLHQGKGELYGGNWGVEILDIDLDVDWYYNDTAFRGLDGLHRIAQPWVDKDVDWGYAREKLEFDGDLLKVEEQNGTGLKDWITAKSSTFPYAILWIRQECICADDVSLVAGTSHNLEIDIGTRGLFRSRAQNHYVERYSDVRPVVTNCPESIVNKQAWLWAFVLSDDNSTILDGPGLLASGRVQSNIETSGGVTRISMSAPWKELDTSVISDIDANLAKFVFKRMPPGVNEISGTTDSSVLYGVQSAHLTITEFDDWDDSDGINRNIWITDSGDSWVRTFVGYTDLLTALKDEIAKVCATGGTSANQEQRSGNSSSGYDAYVTTTYDYEIRDGKMYQFQKSGGTAITKPSRMDGPLAWLLNLGLPRCSSFSALAERITKNHVWWNYAASVLRKGNTNTPDMECLTLGNLFAGDPSLNLQPHFLFVAKYYYQWDWDSSEISAFPADSSGPYTPSNETYFPIAGGKLWLQPADSDVDISANDTVFLGSPDSDFARPKYAKVTPTAVGSDGNYTSLTANYIYSIDGYKSPFWYGTSLYNIPGYHMSPDDIKSAEGNMVGNATLKQIIGSDSVSRSTDPWCLTNSGSSTVSTLSGIFRGLLGETGSDIALIPERYRQRHICNFTEVYWGAREDGEFDHRSMIDWDNLDQVCEHMHPSHKYTIDLHEEVNLYRFLTEELKFHGVHPTYEWDQDLLRFMIRFRRLGPVNVTKAFFEGRTITENDILYGTKHAYTHSNTWLYNKIKARCNYAGSSPRTTVNVTYQSGTTLGAGEDKTLNINAKLSNITGVHGVSLTEGHFLYSFFADRLMYLASIMPEVSFNTLLTTALKCGIGTDVLLTDSTMRYPGSYEPGVSEICALVTSMAIDYSRGIVRMTCTLSENRTYGWAPACLSTVSTKPHPVHGVNYIKATITEHEFSVDGEDRKDCMWFDCYEWDRGTDTYTAKSCSCGDYKVYAYEKGSSSSSVLEFVVTEANVNNYLTLYDSTGTHYAAWDTSKDYIITFSSYDNCEDCQKKFVFFADDNDTIGSSGDPGVRWK